MKKRVLIVIPGTNVKGRSAAFHRFICHIKAYQSCGYEVEVLAFCRDALFTANTKDFDQGTRWIIRPFILPIAKNIILSKILEWYMNFIVAIHSWTGNYDIIQMEMWGTLGCLRKRKGVKYVVDVHGDVPHEVSESRTEGKWYSDYCVYQQKEYLEKADVCIVVNDKQVQQFKENTGLLPKANCIISCGADNDYFNNAPKAEFQDVDLSKRIVLGYAGGVLAWQNIDAMLDMVLKLYEMDKRIYLLFYTGGDMSQYQAKLDKLGKENYHIEKLAPSEVASHLKLMDAGMILRSNLVLNKVSSPTKICEYMAAGLPLICTKHTGDYARCIKQGENGFVGNDPEFTEQELKDLLVWLNKVHDNRGHYSKICMESVKDRSFNNEFKNLEKLL